MLPHGDGGIRKMFIEPDIGDNPPGAGVEVSDAETMLAYLKNARRHRMVPAEE
jgi:hypothetical protein